MTLRLVLSFALIGAASTARAGHREVAETVANSVPGARAPLVLKVRGRTYAANYEKVVHEHKDGGGATVWRYARDQDGKAILQEKGNVVRQPVASTELLKLPSEKPFSGQRRDLVGRQTRWLAKMKDRFFVPLEAAEIAGAQDQFRRIRAGAEVFEAATRRGNQVTLPAGSPVYARLGEGLDGVHRLARPLTGTWQGDGVMTIRGRGMTIERVEYANRVLTLQRQASR
jgi:hypothetical protein